ncbi:uncharacterized protein PFL1_03861 [Pseudozyma flocculosa PF-1]|uniref:Uncharacterized protein n=2 Tax=Pseudozyma flocculosa TaxID=84751 RepID=A0A5C3EW92_9BASI|nr:uncharacterized protein PFL1_03861 [Pseudozyma flocculosa PF-1]EPQ28557.1 hypothetical protein PFL1_03861 [Pseudozyma flocculosa PF-1]SPO36488.1 uncharacterized protein PSFLO_01959 [Pseudozyma flocculosa]
MSAIGSSLRQQARSLLQAARTAPTSSLASTSRALPAIRCLSTSSPLASSRVKPRSQQQARSNAPPIKQTESLFTGILDTLIVGYSNHEVAHRPSGNMVDYAGNLEEGWSTRLAHGEPSWPCTPYSGRSITIGPQSDPARAYGQLSVLLRRNNVRNELRLQQRYEKPNEERRRKKSERHRRRFADMVRKKVQLVMAIKARGA